MTWIIFWLCLAFSVYVVTKYLAATQANMHRHRWIETERVHNMKRGETPITLIAQGCECGSWRQQELNGTVDKPLVIEETV